VLGRIAFVVSDHGRHLRALLGALRPKDVETGTIVLEVPCWRPIWPVS
jgi:hypothetical protein